MQDTLIKRLKVARAASNGDAVQDCTHARRKLRPCTQCTAQLLLLRLQLPSQVVAEPAFF